MVLEKSGNNSVRNLASATIKMAVLTSKLVFLL